jgi:hypothetical protein
MSSVEVNAAPRENFQTLNEHAAQTFFTKSKEGDSPQHSPEKVRQKDEQSPAGSFPDKTATQGRTWLVTDKENYTMAPCCRQVVTGQLKFGKG